MKNNSKSLMYNDFIKKVIHGVLQKSTSYRKILGGCLGG